MASILLNSDSHATIAELQNDIERTLTEAQLTKLSFHHVTMHDTWDYGDPCPECESTRINAVTPVEDTFHSENGEFEHLSDGDIVTDPITVTCVDCHEVLFDIPISEF